MGEPSLALWCPPGCVLSSGHREEALRRLRCALLAGPALRELHADEADPRAALLHCDRCEALRSSVEEVLVEGCSLVLDLCGECRAVQP